MTNMNESIQQLTEALQELAASRRDGTYRARDFPQYLSEKDLTFSKDVDVFLAETRAYSEKTKDVSIGVY